MTDRFANLPDDIADEKRTACSLRTKYRDAPFGGLRKFRALRLTAPGIIAEFVIGAVLFVATMWLLFRDLNVSGLIPVVVFCVKFVVILGVCFWAAGHVWRAIGITARDRVRYVVTNIWSLAGTAVFVLAVLVNVFLPSADEPAVVAPTPAASTETAGNQPRPAVQTETVGSQTPPIVQVAPADRVFAGQGWQILKNSDWTYATALVGDAPDLCWRLGDDWVLADRPDFESLDQELKDSGHVGSFWTASARQNSNLDYFLEADGTSQFRWANSGIDTERIVLCVMTVAL